MSAKERNSSEATTADNSQPMSDITNRRASTYEPLDASRQEPVSYQQLPAAQTRPGRDYYNVRPAPDVNATSPYQQLNVDTKQPPVYQQLAA